MTEAEWLIATEPQEMISHILSLEGMSDRRVGLFMVACCRCLRGLGKRCDMMIDSVEQYQEGILPYEKVEALWPDLNQELGMDYSLEREILVELTHYDPWGHAGIVADKASMFVASNAMSGVSEASEDEAYARGLRIAESEQVDMLRDLFGNPFRPVAFAPAWRTDTAIALARMMYDSREFSAMPILADAMQDAGCDNDDVLSHCRAPGTHVRGCWVCDLVLGKE